MKKFHLTLMYIDVNIAIYFHTCVEEYQIRWSEMIWLKCRYLFFFNQFYVFYFRLCCYWIKSSCLDSLLRCHLLLALRTLFSFPSLNSNVSPLFQLHYTVIIYFISFITPVLILLVIPFRIFFLIRLTS